MICFLRDVVGGVVLLVPFSGVVVKSNWSAYRVHAYFSTRFGAGGWGGIFADTAVAVPAFCFS